MLFLRISSLSKLLTVNKCVQALDLKVVDDEKAAYPLTSVWLDPRKQADRDRGREGERRRRDSSKPPTDSLPLSHCHSTNELRQRK